MFHFQGQKHFDKVMSSFIDFIMCEEHRSAKRSTKMHGHIDGKEQEKILSYLSIKLIVQDTPEQWIVKAIRPQLIPTLFIY